MLLRTSIMSAMQRQQTKKKEKIKASLKRSSTLASKIHEVGRRNKSFQEDYSFDIDRDLDSFDLDSSMQMEGGGNLLSLVDHK